MPAPSDPRPATRRTSATRPGRSRKFADTTVRLVLLLAIVVGAGVAAGYAAGFPLSRVKIDTYQATQLDQQYLAGNFDANDALVEQADLPSGFVPGDPNTIELLKKTQQLHIGAGASFCGDSPGIGDIVDNRITPQIFTSQDSGLTVVSMVVLFKKAQSANTYIRKLGDIVRGCDHFFRTNGETSERINMSDDRKEPPVVDYLNRTLSADKGNEVSEVTFMQVGDSIVELQVVGTSRAPEGFLAKLETSILSRVAPKQFGSQSQIDGELPLPPEPATSTTTSPPVTAPPPETTTTTTIKKKAKKAPATTVKPAATTPPATAPPAT